MIEDKGKYYRCSCSEQVLRIELNDWDENIKDFWISIYEYSQNRMSIVDKIRHCYKTLVHGKPYGDQIILDKESAKKLAEFIMEKLNEGNNKRGIRRQNKISGKEKDISIE